MMDDKIVLDRNLRTRHKGDAIASVIAVADYLIGGITMAVAPWSFGARLFVLVGATMVGSAIAYMVFWVVKIKADATLYKTLYEAK